MLRRMEVLPSSQIIMTTLLHKLKPAPKTPGIYLFYNKKKALVYVGKATNLRARIHSYFVGPKSYRPIETLFAEVKNIHWLKTDSVLEAIILEAHYIKKFQPKYNVLGKDDKSWNYLYLSNDPFPQLKAIRQHELVRASVRKTFRAKKIFGPFPGLNTKAILKILRRLFHYSDCRPGQGKPCFYRQINLCSGVCTGEISTAEYRRKIIKPLSLFLSGKKKAVIKELKRQMLLVSKAENYEAAAILRDQIFNLKKIQDFTLLKSTVQTTPTSSFKFKISRVEGYDISNLGSTGKVGSLVTFVNGEPDKAAYKKFRIKTVAGQSDVDCLAEVLTRRLKHTEWKLPDLVLVDGGKPQLSAARGAFKKAKNDIPIVGIAKGPTRKNNKFFTSDKQIIPWIKQNKETLIRVRDEAHRFAIKYQRQLRKIK